MIDAVHPPPQEIVRPAFVRPAETRLLTPGFFPATGTERQHVLSELIAAGRLDVADAARMRVVRLSPDTAMLLATQLIGFGTCRDDAAPADATFTANASSATTSLSYSFSSQNFGPASAGRHMVVGVAGQAGSAAAVSSVTIGGVSATQVFSVSNSSVTAAFWIAPVPTGTSGTVVVGWAAQRARCAIVLWAITGLLGTGAVDTGSAINSGAGALADTLDVSAGGVVLAIAYDGGTGSRSWTWSGLTEVADTTFATGRSYTGASSDFAAAQTGLTVQATPSGSTTANILAAVSLR